MTRVPICAGIGLIGALLFTTAAFATQAYVVQEGDTLWSIAARHRVTVSALVVANQLVDPDALRLGQRLIIPAARARVAPDVIVAPAAAAAHRGSSTVVPSRGAKWASVLVRVATRYRGVRYRWGGVSARGFDCSGFVYFVMQSVGVSLPRTTYGMFAGGTPVARDQLRIGDIILFQTVSPGPSHAGIYIGNNQFIHSSSGYGRVTVTSLDSRYYKPRYLGARRF